MDLDVLMPDGRKVRLTVERRTPMMDLLVQAASATKISPGGHVIHVFSEGGDKGSGALQYKPSTPIGSLDTKTISIVPKKEAGDPFSRRMGKTANRPFEPTFRVQVHLPRNQLTVLRVSPRIKISELKGMVCREKGLDTTRYQLVRPSAPTQPLSGDMTLADYGSTEITLLSNSSIESHICNSTSHILSYSKRAEETKRKNGILRLLTEDANNKVNEITNYNSISQIDGNQRNKVNKPEEVQVHQTRYKPKKRRPAPPPPPPLLPEAPSHSRQSSSDSSGYHEATSSFLHEEHSSEEKASSDSSGVSSLDAKEPQMQPSPPPPIANSKKKKAPAPPPPAIEKEKPVHRIAPKCPPTKSIPIQQDSIRDSVVEKDNISAEKSKHTDTTNNTGSCSEEPAHKDIKDSAIEKNDAFRENHSLKNNNQKADVCSQELTHNDIKQKSDCLEQEHCVNNDVTSIDSPTKSSVILLNQTVEDKPSVVSSKDPSLAAEFTISTYSTSEKDPIIPDNAAISKDNLMKKDYLTRENGNTAKDQIQHRDHVIPRDQVLKQDAEGKLDLRRVRESEGQHRMTVAAKAVPFPNVSTESIKEKRNTSEITLPAKENKTSCFVLDTYRCRTPEKRTDKDTQSCKGEAVSTKVALVALNARIEQDVTQQEIASSIQAAFHSVDCTPQPSLLAIKQRNNNEDSNVHSNRVLPNGHPNQEVPDSSLESVESVQAPLPTTTTVRVSVNTDSENRHFKEPSPEVAKKFGDLEREALLIDEEPRARPVSTGCVSSKGLRRSSSLLNFSDVSPRKSSLVNNKRVRHLQRSLSDLSTDDKEDFEAEQERLQREYIKLQRQFILWQQQLMNNHAMLREECIVPQYARTLRQSHSLPEGEDSFEETTPSVPLVSRSLSYEPTKDRCSTLPRSAINITSFDFGSIPIGNGTSTLRSSKTKNYFKPPQIRVSTKSRQRLPPEIKKEGDVDITDDAKMLTTILPSFESLKLITENNDDEDATTHSRLKDCKTPATPTEGGRKIPVVHLSSTFPKLNSRLNNGDNSTDRDLKYVNGDTGQSKLRADCSEKQLLKSQLPPPPPPMPIVSKCSVSENCIKSTGQKNGVGKRESRPEVDPREQLMFEIRKFGGRTALRKISLAS